MAKIHELMQERATVTQSIRALMDKYDASTEMSAEDKQALERMEADFDKIDARVKLEEKQLARERMEGEAAPEQGNAATGESERMKAFCDHLRDGERSSERVYAALQQSNPSQAGYLVAPEKFSSDLIAELDNSLFFRTMAKKYRLKGAHSLGFPKRVNRMSSAAWGTEISAPKPDESLSFDKREFKPQFMTAEILLSRTLVYNAPEVDSIVRNEIAYDVGELLETAYMTGDGEGKPLGVFTVSDKGISAERDVSKNNTATEMTFDGLMEAKYSIKNQYQSRLKWIFHRDGVKMLAKIKNNDGQYIWQPSVVVGTPDMLLGKPVLMSEYAPNTFTANQYVGILGDFSHYWICDGQSIEVQVLKELYARTNQIDYVARLSTDGMPVLEEAFARVKLAAA